MLYWVVYLIDVITPLKEPCALLSIFGILFWAYSFFGLAEHRSNYWEDKDDKIMRNITKGVTIASIILMLLAVFIPSKTTAYTLLGIKLGQTVISKPEVQIKVDKLSNVIDIKLNKYIQEEGR